MDFARSEEVGISVRLSLCWPKRCWAVQMVMCCEIEIEGAREKEFVLLPNGLYLLPDEQLAPLNPWLVWCQNCGNFKAGESIPSADSIHKLISDAKAGTSGEFYDFFFRSNENALSETIASWERELHWRNLRSAPPKCLRCGSAAIRRIELSDPATLTHPPTGNRLKFSPSFASTGIDLQLSLFTSEGDFLGEITRIDPDSREYVDDSSPYALVKGQGNRTLVAWKTSVNRRQDCVVPTGAESLAANRVFGGSVSLQNVQRHAAKSGGDFRR